MPIPPLDSPRPRAGPLESSALGVLLGSAAAIAGSFGVRMIAARALAAEELGALLLAVAVASFAGMAAGLGLRSATARRVSLLRAAGAAPDAGRAARTALGLALATGALAALVMPWLPRFGLGELARLAPAMLLAVAPACFGLPLGLATWGISQGHHDTRGRAILRDGLGSLLRLGGVALAALLLDDGAGQAWVFALAWGLGSLAGEGSFVAYGLARGWFAGAAPGIDRPLLASLPPFTGTALVGLLGTWLDLLLLGAIAPLPVVAGYALAQSVGRVLGQISDSASHRFLPLAADAAAAGDDRGLASHYQSARELAFRYLWVGLAPCLLCPDALVRLAFGAGYADASTALRWLAAGWLVRGLVGYAEESLFARGQAGRVFALVLASTLGSAVLLVLWAPSGGVVGAGLAAAAGLALRGIAGVALLGSLAGQVVSLPALGRLAATAVPALVVAVLLSAISVPLWLAPLAITLAAAPGALGQVRRAVLRRSGSTQSLR